MSGAVLLESSLARLRRFRSLAEEARLAAERMADPDSRRTMLYLADNYDSLADHIEEQIDRSSTKRGSWPPSATLGRRSLMVQLTPSAR